MTKTVVATAFGGPAVLRVIDEPDPTPGAGEVLVELRAIGVNPFDYKVYSGEFGTDESTLPLRLGGEASGVVTAVGQGAVGPAGAVNVGDEVILSAVPGAYTERVVVPGDSVIPKIAHFDWESAAGWPAVSGTADEALETVGLGEGETVLVHGGAGGVGLLVIQLSKIRGATVIATAREANHDALRELGAIPITYGEGLIDRVRSVAPDEIDAAIDTVGTDEAVDVSLELLADRKRLVTISAFERAGKEGFPAIGGASPKSGEIRRASRLKLAELAASKGITVKVAKTFPLANAAQAHAELQQAHPSGKFVLIP
ncbi:NADPH:quinone reductase-like Zn-dependent oxidoreductase [Antricoccus suffuscus]|uniref:NADPH:quinone reductase-like Zn-dependent oxidoreductase n=1 Tax=Antricoccus suffuscus TaxID=1629062 RepID=A0A2T1A516_9ACTN|nr:NADP-dependent oxidoreductase [Antricoccus suffuscus]PRZ43695.1 NADPH:quinone reductase-like Zn-dependent oxidoreductase [Antricoccus suffuscus]